MAGGGLDCRVPSVSEQLRSIYQGEGDIAISLHTESIQWRQDSHSMLRGKYLIVQDFKLGDGVHEAAPEISALHAGDLRIVPAPPLGPPLDLLGIVLASKALQEARDWNSAFTQARICR